MLVLLCFLIIKQLLTEEIKLCDFVSYFLIIGANALPAASCRVLLDLIFAIRSHVQ